MDEIKATENILRSYVVEQSSKSILSNFKACNAINLRDMTKNNEKCYLHTRSPLNILLYIRIRTVSVRKIPLKSPSSASAASNALSFLNPFQNITRKNVSLSLS